MSKRRILIVDDDPHAVEILTRMLERQGCDCRSTLRGAEALRLPGEAPADVILLEVMMAETDGLEVCERLRADAVLNQIPVMLRTARDDMDTRARGMMLDASEFLTKPINKRELFTRIESQLHAQEISRQLSRTNAAVANTAGAD